MNMITVYWTCLLLGFIWLAIQMLLADFGGDFGHFDVDPSGMDVNVDGMHVDSVDVHGMGEIQLSPVSPMIISGFVTIFGAAGVIVTNMEPTMHLTFNVLIAIGVALVGAAFLWVVLRAIIRAVSGSSEAKVQDLIGYEAEVITPIRGAGVGEIAFVYNGSRYNSPARDIHNTDIERNSIVKIVKIVGPTYFVRALTADEMHGEGERKDISK
jgi:membrane-bound ClpP family serine protease